MAGKKKKSGKKPIEQYDHKGKRRVNNPPVGLVSPDTDKETGKKSYAYDPHIDPSLQWAGKAEHTSFGKWKWEVSRTSADVKGIIEDIVQV